MPEIGVGLVGYGFAGSVFHAPLIGSVAGLRLRIVATTRREQVERDLPGVRVASGASDLFSDENVNLVVVASPSASHFDVARAALLAGRHVVVDKPFALTVAQADELIHIAQRQDRVLSVFQNRRWDGDFLTVRHCIDEGWLGDVVYYEAHFDRFRPQIKAGWREQPGPGSGVLYDLGAHLVDQALQLFGMPRAVTADVFQQRLVARADDYFHLVLDYGSRRAVLHSSMLVAEPGPRFTVHGTGGSFVKYGIDGQEDALKRGERPGDAGWGTDAPSFYGELVLANGSRRTVETLHGSYERFYQGMARCLENGGPVPVNPLGSRDGLMVIEAALRSAAEGRAVRL